MENTIKVLKREEVSAKNQQIFDRLKKAYGAVPNLYSTLAYSENALEAYINLESSNTSLTSKEIEAATLVVSEVNQCFYCLSAHTMVAKLKGFTEEQTLEIRRGEASFDKKLDALVKLTKQLSENRHPGDGVLVTHFFEAGYTKENLIDLIVHIGDRTISNILHAVTQVPNEFPRAKSIC
ncbi:carboxymuconolactone decarboxylase family protein [Sphingobacterium sp. N143]|uniref:carboxymuconolactone decarboxylase family protein n=1 Tax=Sphingobacterium sp. N143 TaxID=2746727 RepID=UPI0025764C55|nr:carboxymuconolactone decarboxylase family protein [Sphingobacterium sp. N143]MDM1293995.1 carboxymuconolactone decarboxylase family protein [Sphingobacterium sp. N143]